MSRDATDLERPVLVLTALPAEARALCRRHSLSRRFGAPARWRGRVNGRPVDVVATGTGARRARQAIEGTLAAQAPAVVLGIGVAGALSPGFEIGDLLVAERLVAPGGEPRVVTVTRSPWLERALALRGARAGTLVTSKRIASTARAKAELAARIAGGAPAAVDMESHAWSVAAAAAGVPFVAVRAVSDLASEDLPFDLNRALRSDGSISVARVAAAAVLRPATWNGLKDLRDRVRKCSRALEQAVASMLD